MGPAVVGGDLHPVRLRAGPHIVGPGPDLKGPGTARERERRLRAVSVPTLNLLLSTVAGCQHKLVRDERTSTEPHVVDKERHYPGPLVLLRLEASHDPVLSSRVVPVILNTADVCWAVSSIEVVTCHIYHQSSWELPRKAAQAAEPCGLQSEGRGISQSWAGSGRGL